VTAAAVAREGVGVSTLSLAAASGISHGYLFRLFGSKDELLRRLCVDALDRLGRDGMGASDDHALLLLQLTAAATHVPALAEVLGAWCRQDPANARRLAAVITRGARLATDPEPALHAA